MQHNNFLITGILSAGIALGLSNYANAAQADNRAVVHDARGNVVVNDFDNCVRTKWQSTSDECGAKLITKTKIHTIKHFDVPDEERTAYFEFDRSELMQSEHDKLLTLANKLKAMEGIAGVKVIGYADRIGSDDYNEKLSKRRAKEVEKFLQEHGYLKTTVPNIRWLGESVPITKCAAGTKRAALISCLQKDRRVTVEIQYQDRVTDTITDETTTN
jgi:OOP family OmpA-OmpF porin